MGELTVRAAAVACHPTPAGGLDIVANVAGTRFTLAIEPPAADDRDGLDALGLMGLALFQVYASAAIRQLDARLPPERPEGSTPRSSRDVSGTTGNRE